MKTSWSDRLEYKEICKLFATDDTKFKTFRNHSSVYNEVLEHVKYNTGKDYLNIILKQTPKLFKDIKRYLKNDEVGTPTVFDYPSTGSRCSPTTLRYIKVLSDLICNESFNVDTPKVIEIGGGYGGQCRVIYEYNPNVDYYIVDLEESIMLQKKYLAEFGINNVTFLTPDDVRKLNEEFDLVISNFAFNECYKQIQELYMDKIILNSINGYISGIFYGGDSYSQKEFTSQLPSYVARTYLPDTGFDCKIITW